MEEAKEFVTGAAAIDSLQRSSRRMLSSFQQNLELFRRPALDNSSALKEILEKNQNPRLERYIEAGYRHLSSDKNIISELNSSIRGLQDHVRKVDTCLGDLEKLLDAATAMDVSLDSTYCNYVTSMALVYSMLQQDHEMQAKVVEDLALDMRSETLQNYCTMWALRPFVDDELMQDFLQNREF